MRTVKRAYMVYGRSRVARYLGFKRVLIDDLGFVFVSGSGWHTKESLSHFKFITLPGDIPRNVDKWWDYKFKFEQLTDWAWCYMNREKRN